jgi:hypothetical protein
VQQHVVQGWDVTVDARTNADIKAFEDFMAAITGPLSGFWFPTPLDGMLPQGGVSNTQFDILDQGLADTWADHPDVHLFFSRDGVASQAAKITAVVNLGNGKERVTINVALADWATLFAPGANVKRLHYVRWVDNEEHGKFQAEGWLRRDVRVVELPTEYTAQELGEMPVLLYHLWCAAPMDFHWYYTSFAADVVFQGNLHKAYPMNHGKFRQGVKAQSETLDIDAAYDPNHPFSLFQPIPFPRKMNVEVWEANLQDLLNPMPVPAAQWSADAIPVQADGSLIGSVTDSSGNGHTLTTDITTEPIYSVNAINGKPAFRFDSDRYFKLPAAWYQALTAGEIFTVIKTDNDPDVVPTPKGRIWALGAWTTGSLYPGSDGHIYENFGLGAGNALDVGNPALTLTAWRLYNVAAGLNTYRARLNAADLYNGDQGVPTFNDGGYGPKIGHTNASGSFWGSMAEILLYDRVLTDGERAKVEAYLSDKYALGLAATAGSLITSKVFVGRLRKVRDSGEKLTAECDSFLAMLSRRAPGMQISKDCSYNVYDERTCKAVQAFFETTATVVAIHNDVSPPTVDMTLLFPTAEREAGDYFAQGWMEIGRGLQFEVRTILASSYAGGILTLTLNAPLVFAIAGQDAEIIPGCDGGAPTCLDKFHNFDNHGGFVDIPEKNLSLQAVEATATAGDKK